MVLLSRPGGGTSSIDTPARRCDGGLTAAARWASPGGADWQRAEIVPKKSRTRDRASWPPTPTRVGPGRPSTTRANEQSCNLETRIDRRFAALKAEGRAALVTFITAGDPDPDASRKILLGLPAAGADVIELGMPFSDPMADGPAIQLSSQRALKAGMTLKKTLALVRDFRAKDDATPIVLMGYYNPIFVYPTAAFLDEAKAAGVDGLIVVDVPPEADEELCLPARERGINFIRLAAPTTDAKRLPAVLQNTSGFVYYVSITGITGSAAPEVADVHKHVARIKRATRLPVAVGFGVRTPEQVRQIGAGADGVVVGSALVNAIKESLGNKGQATPRTAPAVLDLVKSLARPLRGG